MGRRGWIRAATFAAIIAAAWLLYRWFIAAWGPVDWREVFSSREALRAFVRRFDPYGPAVFFVLQFAQVIVAPIPGNVTALAGGALFGLWPGFLLSSAALVAGSIVAFWLARFYGRPLVERFVPKAVIDRYIDGVAQRHFALLLAAFALPFFPDDALCFIAGLSALRFPVFLLLVVVGRPPGMFVASLVGAGIAVVPWWAWTIIALVSAGLLYQAYRYRDAIESRFAVVSAPAVEPPPPSPTAAGDGGPDRTHSCTSGTGAGS